MITTQQLLSVKNIPINPPDLPEILLIPRKHPGHGYVFFSLQNLNFHDTSLIILIICYIILAAIQFYVFFSSMNLWISCISDLHVIFFLYSMLARRWNT